MIFSLFWANIFCLYQNETLSWHWCFIDLYCTRIVSFICNTTQRVPLVEQELPTLSGPPEFTSRCLWGLCCWICSFLCIVFKIIVCSFGYCIVCPSMSYGFWLPLWYLLTVFSCSLCICLFLNYVIEIKILFRW